MHEADLGDRRSQLLVAVSVELGIVPVVREKRVLCSCMKPISVTAALSYWSQLGSSLASCRCTCAHFRNGWGRSPALATLSAVALNLLFNKLGGPERHALTGAHN